MQKLDRTWVNALPTCVRSGALNVIIHDPRRRAGSKVPVKRLLSRRLAVPVTRAGIPMAGIVSAALHQHTRQDPPKRCLRRGRQTSGDGRYQRE
jgi:hypothetical protein